MTAITDRVPTATTDTDDAPAAAARPWRRWLNWFLILAALALTAYLLHRTLSKYSLTDIGAALMALPRGHLALAALFAAASYATLTLFDHLAVRTIGHRLPYRNVAFTSFVSLSIGHSVGLAGLSSGAIRYRFYARWGLTVQEVAKIILFTGLTVAVGLMALAGIALAAAPALAAELMGVSRSTPLLVAAVCLAGVAAYVALAHFRSRPVKIWRWRVEIPSTRVALLQVLVGTVNFALVSACLHQCIAGIAEVPYLSVVAVYVSANVATLITHVPGGLGVIESVVLYLLPAQQVIGAVIAFRVIYFLIPLALGTTLFLITAVTMRKKATA